MRSIEKIADGAATSWLLHIQPNDRAWRMFGPKRDLLVRAVAYQLQVKAFGGLSPVTKRVLRETPPLRARAASMRLPSALA